MIYMSKEKAENICTKNNSDDDDSFYRVELRGNYAVVAVYDGATGELLGYL